MTDMLWFYGLAAVYGLLNLVRLVLVLAERRRQRAWMPTARPASDVTVLQPILGGDPCLADCLAANLRQGGDAHFLWLLDEEDAAGQAAARRAADGAAARLILDIAPAPPVGCNPKMTKLVRGLAQVTTPFVAVLDDDTILPPGMLGRAAGLVGAGDLVTGLPLYAARSTIWSRLVTGFVNANALLTYLPAARLGLSRTVNGMFTVMRTDDLRRLGGFAAIAQDVTDDYALACLFRQGGGRVIQTDMPVTIITHVTNLSHYLSLMRRWMVFARLYLTENLSPPLLLFVLLPGVLALPLLLAAAWTGPLALVVALLLLAGKAGITQWLRGGGPWNDLLFDLAGEMLMPLHALTSGLGGPRIRWRGRSMVLEGKRITDAD